MENINNEETLFGEMEHDNLYGRFYVNAESVWNELGKQINFFVNEQVSLYIEDDISNEEMETDEGYDFPRADPSKKVQKRNRDVDADESADADDDADSDMFGSPDPKTKRIGGDNKKTTLIKYLDFGIPDTMHDFGGTRNDAFPSDPSPGNFLNEAKIFLNYPDLEYKSDPLKMYYEGNFNDFEKRVKIDYILGKLCDVYGINFFFNQNIKDYAKINADILAPLEENKPNKLNFFYETNLKKQGYKYYFLDACMSIQCDPEFKSHMTTLKSLCDLWDPVGSSELDEKEMAEKNTDLNINFELEADGFYNALYLDGENKKSLYDEAYDPLLNVKCLEQYGIHFKLRLKQINANKYTVTIQIIQNKTGEKSSFPLKNGGFTLHSLAVGLAYVSSGYSNTNIDEDLKNIITHIQNIENSITPDDFKRMLTRFKSSGDHGSARTASLVNRYCGNAKDKTIYLSGDQLCYVYSMLIGNPTLFRYYAPNKPLADSTKEEDTSCEVCMPNRIHFLGFFSPKKTTRFYTNIIQRCNGFIKTYLIKLLSSTESTTTTVLSSDQITNHTSTVGRFSESGYSLSEDDMKELQTIIGELSYSFDYILTSISNDASSSANLDETAKVLLAMENLLHSIFYLMNKETFIKEYEQVFATQQQIIDNLMKKDDNPQNRPRRNQPQGIIFDKTFLNTFKSYNIKKKDGNTSFFKYLKGENSEFYEKIVVAKKNFGKIMTTFFSGLKTTVGPASVVVNEKLVERLTKDELDRSLKLRGIDESYASAIIELYGLSDLNKGGRRLNKVTSKALPSQLKSKCTQKKRRTRTRTRTRSKKENKRRVSIKRR